MMEGTKGANHPEEDMGDGMACSDHPFRTNSGGICAFCLQEKLGKLVSSSLSHPIRPSISSSSSPPSFRSERSVNSGNVDISSSSLALSLSDPPRNGATGCDEYCKGRAKIPFLLAKKKKVMVATASSSSDRASSDVSFKRSKSTVAARRGVHLLGADTAEDFCPRKRGGFWSFLHLSSRSTKKIDKSSSTNSNNTAFVNGFSVVKSGVGSSSSLSKEGGILVEDEDESANTLVERKISRSRSVGCGSRSFSGDFFERISTGFGDCTLRRVESQREGKPKLIRQSNHHCMKEKVKCGRIFGGFMITSSSSSSSSSSSMWASSSAKDMNGKPTPAHGRSGSWSWAFASPMRAFSKPSSLKEGKRDAIGGASSNKSNASNLAAIPSLLAVGS